MIYCAVYPIAHWVTRSSLKNSIFHSFTFNGRMEFDISGAAAASRIYVDAITKLARQAQQATWSGCNDIGKVFPIRIPIGIYINNNYYLGRYTYTHTQVDLVGTYTVIDI